jgi:pilus assembly protein CpaB
MARGIGSRLTPLLHERVRQMVGARGWPRALAVRRVVAVALVLLAAVLAVRPDGQRTAPAERIVVAARDLRPGVELQRADLLLRELPVAAVPAGTRQNRAAFTGRVLVSAARSGEPITDARVLGRANTALTATGPEVVSVGVRLADPGVAGLLRPGARVDVVAGSTEPASENAELAAADATVITVRDAEAEDGTPAPIVVLALPRESATRVASLSLRQPVTVTLR